MFRIATINALALFGILTIIYPNCFAQQLGSTEALRDDEKQLCTVAGEVLRAGTDEPLRKARVVLRSEDNSSAAPYVTKTDAGGRFTIEGIRAGRYDFYVEHNGYVPKFYGEDNQGNSSTILTLKPAQQVKEVIFRLLSYGAIAGRVFDEDGDPAEGVTVEVLEQRTRRGKVSTSALGHGTTNDLGEYRIFALQPGRYFVRAHPSGRGGEDIGGRHLDDSILEFADGYVPTYYPNVPDISRASPIEVNPGDEVSGVELVLLHQQTYKVRGRVVNAVTNHPGGQMRVEIVPENPYSEAGGESRSAFPDEETGEFEIGGIPGGRYTAFAEWSDGENTYVGSAPLETLNGSAESVRIIVTRGTDLRGRISVEGSAVVSSDLRVGVILRDTRHLGATRTAKVKSDGTFLVTGLADGRYDVDVYSRCEVCYLKAATADGSDIFDMGLYISSGSAPPPIELVYSSRTGAVDGTVLREDGLAASGAKVVLVPDHPRNDNFSGYFGGYREADTDQYGRFIVKGVPPGNYRAFTCQSVDYDNYTDPEFLKPYEKKAQALTIGEDEKKTLQLTLLSTSSKNR